MGRVMFSVCSLPGGGGIPQSQVLCQVLFWEGGQSRVLSQVLSGGGTAVPGHWFQVLSRWYPSPGGYPPTRLWWVPPSPAKPGWGILPGQDRTGVTPPPPPPIEQQSEHFLRGERYAACVHAGGLSCWWESSKGGSAKSGVILKSIYWFPNWPKANKIEILISEDHTKMGGHLKLHTRTRTRRMGNNRSRSLLCEVKASTVSYNIFVSGLGHSQCEHA